MKNNITVEDSLSFYLWYDGDKIGFALFKIFEKNKFFLWNFIIDCQYQSRGIGKKFLIDIINILKKIIMPV
ncbi:MAG: GNAT family N-acetyltransferase [Lachnospirales bacterium]